MFCDFETTQDGEQFRHRCRRCGTERVTGRPALQRPCTSMPTLSKQVVTYTLSTAAWVAAGMPVRTSEEQDAISAICQGCDKLNGKRCRLCGCLVKAKIKRATEHCPEGRW